jgi:hypothetical protein
MMAMTTKSSTKVKARSALLPFIVPAPFKSSRPLDETQRAEEKANAGYAGPLA